MSPQERQRLGELERRVAWAEWRLGWAEWRIRQLEAVPPERRAAAASGAGEAPPEQQALFPGLDRAAAVAAAVARSAYAGETSRWGTTGGVASGAPSPGALRPRAAGAQGQAASPTGAARAAASGPSFVAPASPPVTSSEGASSQGAASRAAPPRADSEPDAFGAPLSPPPTAPRAFDWESLIGVRLFAWLGGAALFVGAALFLHYSIQQNLISPAVRVAIGLAIGAAALPIGERLRTNADRAGQAIGGAGVAILYASLFAARTLYGLVPSAIAFAGMTLVTAAAGALAVRRDAFMLAILGLVGGFLTPYLLSTGEDRPVALFAYVALLDAGVVAVAAKRRWPSLALLGLAGSSAVFAGWSLRFLDATKAPYALLAAAALAAVFAIASPEAWPRGARGDEAAAREPAPIARATAGIAAILPLVLALVVAGSDAIPVAPAVLVPYLLVLSAGAWIAGRRAELDVLAPVAASFCALTLAARADATLFPSARGSTLALFAVVPIAWGALWAARRRATEGPALRIAATIAIAGVALFVVTRASMAEGARAPVLPLALFGWLGAGLLVAMAAIEASGASSARVLGAQAIEVVLLLVLCAGFQRARVGEYVPIVVAPMIAFAALPLLGARLRRDLLAWGASAGALVVHFVFLYAITDDAWGDGALGALSVVCGVATLGLLAFARARGAEPRVAVTATLGGVALLFFTAAFPILLANEWLTVAWALEAAALAWLRRRVRHTGLLVASALLAGATVLRLVVNPAVLAYHARSGTPVLNWWLYAYGVSALAMVAAYVWLKGDDDARRFRLPWLFATAAGVLFFVLMNVEIADAYSSGAGVTLRWSGGGFAQDMTYTLGWGLFALAVFALGMATRSRPARIWALALLLATAAKGALHDTWALGSLYRVAAIVSLAIALLVVSFLTQRFVLRKEENG